MLDMIGDTKLTKKSSADNSEFAYLHYFQHSFMIHIQNGNHRCWKDMRVIFIYHKGKF
jgi:hypothetical protein